MHIEVLDRQDLSSLREFLEAHLTSSLFILNNMQRAGLDYTGESHTGEYFALVSDDRSEVYGVLVHYWNAMVFTQCPDPANLQLLLSYFIDHCSRPVAGVIAEANQARICLPVLEIQHANYSVRRDEDLMYLVLSDLNADYACLPAQLSVSRPQPQHARLLFEWLMAYEIESLGAVADGTLQRRCELKLHRYLDDEEGWLLFDQEQAVSFSGFNARTPTAVQIGPVWTPPQHRNRGYAKRLVAATLMRAAKNGVSQAVLFTENPIAHRAYASLGFKDIGKYALSLLVQPQMIGSEPR